MSLRFTRSAAAALLLLAACTSQTPATAPPADEASGSAPTATADRPGDRAPAADEAATAAPATPPPPQTGAAEGSGTAGWERVTEPTPAQVEMQALADSHRAALARELMVALTTASAGGNFANAVEACRLQAPTLTAAAQEGSGEYSLTIGRTSERLRNPANVPPDTIAALIGAAEPEGVWARDDALAVITPIPTGPLCLNCHGPADAIAEPVRAALAQAYPLDQAVGYADGDRRGWFWAEVRASR